MSNGPRLNDGGSTALTLVALGRTFTVPQRPDALDHAFAVWDAGIGMARYLEHDRRLLASLRGKRVLELGAGTGLLAAVLAHAGAQVVATDLAHVCDFLRTSIASNGVAMVPTDGGGGGAWSPPSGGCVAVAACDWKDAAAPAVLTAAFGPFDAVIGTDVVYSEQLVRPLLECAAAVCALSGRRRCVAHFANEVRDETTTALFSAVARELFVVKEVPGRKLPADVAGTSLRVFEMKLRAAGAGATSGSATVELAADEAASLRPLTTIRVDHRAAIVQGAIP